MESNNDYLQNNRYLYICEGKTDEDKLKKIGCLYVLTTGGKFFRKEITEFLKTAHQERQFVIITDPDGPGRNISERIEKYVGSCIVVKAEKKKAIAKNKVGIAQMDIEDIKDLLHPYIYHDIYCEENPSFDSEDYFDLALSGPGSKEKRMRLVEHYSLPYTSAKKVEEFLLILNKDINDIKEVIDNDQ
ncbi:MAG: DUF4093 domain-containing protein [Bacilli bacterium]